MSPFIYDIVPINAEKQIRLLTLLPSPRISSTGLHDASIRCSLKAVSLIEKPAYKALSYTWGAETPLREIVIDEKTFGVTVNLHAALCHLQEDKPIHLWVDAICINQKDEHEKNKQVEQMGVIYKAATQVLAWLGPAADDSDIAMHVLENLGGDALKAGVLNIHRDVHMKLWQPDPQGLLTSIRQPIEDLSKRTGPNLPHAAIKSLTQRNYWTRTWIVQEFSLAADLVIICGSKRLPVAEFMAAYIFIGMNRTIATKSISASDLIDPIRGPPLEQFLQAAHSGAPSKMIGSRRRYKQQTSEYHSSMMELLILFSTSLEASNPRDKIYGFLGLAPDFTDLDIKVDYNKKPYEVFTDTAKALLRNNYTDILAWCQFPKQQPNLPSWVPDFTSTLREPYGSYKCRTLIKPLFSASGSSDVTISAENTSDSPSTITISGLTIDTINEVGSVWENPKNADDSRDVPLFLDEIAYFCSQAQSAPKPIVRDPKFWSEAFWRIPCADQEYHGPARERAGATAQDGFREVVDKYNNDHTGYEDPLRTASFTRYYMAMQYLYGLRPFISEQGYVGLVPEHARPGDSICVIFGAIVPFVLRKVPGGGLKLVGEAYVHGIMDGEAMEMGLGLDEFRLS
jgi:hypothetical protein